MKCDTQAFVYTDSVHATRRFLFLRFVFIFMFWLYSNRLLIGGKKTIILGSLCVYVCVCVPLFQ